jgi:hypothetical protein
VDDTVCLRVESKELCMTPVEKRKKEREERRDPTGSYRKGY